MNKQQVLSRIGKNNWEKFSKFMVGQTVGVSNTPSGREIIDYYDTDVDHFVEEQKKRLTKGEPKG